MITAEEARRLILENTPRLGVEKVSLESAGGRILAEDLTAREDLPSFDNSAMDGYAVRSVDLAGAAEKNPVELITRETVKAGDFPRTEVGPGEAFRILTGAPVPRGADCVVMQEFTRPGAAGKTCFLRTPKAGEHIRRAGEDVRKGAPLLAVGALVRPYEIGLLAAQGFTDVSVSRKPRVAVLASGDELVPHSAGLQPGKIRNSNGPAMAAALRRWKLEVFDAGIVPDNQGALEARIKELLGQYDILLLSGGVSVGEFDFCKHALEGAGVREIFWGVAIKPGKPLWFGIHRPAGGGTPRPVFGLPGNPVSVLVCVEEFVRGALEAMEGVEPGHSGFHHAGTAANDYPKDDERQRYVFCKVGRNGGEYSVTIIRPQGAAMVGMSCQANALAMRPVGAGPIRKGDPIKFRWLK